MELIKRLRIPINSPAVHAGLSWLSWCVFWGTVPIWGTALLLSLFDKPLVFNDFLKNGEFVLYAASFIGGALYTIRRDIFPSRNALNWLFFLALAVCLIVFTAITITTTIGQNPSWLKINQTVLAWISVLVFFFTALFCFAIAIADELGVGRDIPDRFKQDGAALEEGLDKLLAEQAKNKGAPHHG